MYKRTTLIPLLVALLVVAIPPSLASAWRQLAKRPSTRALKGLPATLG